MIGSPEVIAALQSAVAAEAHLNQQYRLDWRAVKAMGVKVIAKKLKLFGHDAHSWFREVTDRLLEFEQKPSFSVPQITERDTLTLTLQNELALEMAILGPYEDAIQVAMKAKDDNTRNKFEHWIKWHQGHVVWLERQLRLIDALGEADYITTKL